jgi:ribosome-associated protein
LGNKELALRKMYQKLNNCFVVRKKRKATKATYSSKLKRLDSKKRNSEIKQARGKVRD